MAAHIESCDNSITVQCGRGIGNNCRHSASGDSNRLQKQVTIDISKIQKQQNQQWQEQQQAVGIGNNAVQGALSLQVHS